MAKNTRNTKTTSFNTSGMFLKMGGKGVEPKNAKDELDYYGWLSSAIENGETEPLERAHSKIANTVADYLTNKSVDVSGGQFSYMLSIAPKLAATIEGHSSANVFVKSKKTGKHHVFQAEDWGFSESDARFIADLAGVTPGKKATDKAEAPEAPDLSKMTKKELLEYIQQHGA